MLRCFAVVQSLRSSRPAHAFDLPFSSVVSPASRSFLLCATSQLYTRANATSRVYYMSVFAAITEPNTTYCDLFPQEV